MDEKEEQFWVQALEDLHEIRSKVNSLCVKAVSDELQLSKEVVSDVMRLAQKRHRLNRPLLASEIKVAFGKFGKIKDVADWLDVSTPTLKKYLTLYGLKEQYWKPTKGTPATFEKMREARLRNIEARKVLKVGGGEISNGGGTPSLISMESGSIG